MHKFLDWPVLENDLNILAEKIDITPDIILSLPNGSFVIAYLLSKKLHLNNINILHPGLNVQKKNVLLVADFLNDLTLEKTKKELIHQGAIVKTAAMYKISKPIADYYVQNVENVTFPWEHG